MCGCRSVALRIPVAAILSEIEMWLLKNSCFSQNSRNLGDRKCSPKGRLLFVGLPIAISCRPFSGELVFQQPHDISPVIEPNEVLQVKIRQ
jgi:hypothetical protein